jgi:CRP-like cAMP-binding protein
VASASGSAEARIAAVSHEVFSSALGPELAAELASRGFPRSYSRGQALFHEGQAGDSVFLIRHGRIKAMTTTSNGREVVLAFRGPGDLLGEQSALDGQPRSATVCAVERVEAVCLSADSFRAFLAAHGSVSLILLGMLSRRLRDADAKRIEFSAFTAIERVAARLLELAERFGVQSDGSVRIELPLSQEELAGATGASLESVGRALHTMRSLKCIETRRREIRILDRESLEALRRAGR